MKKIISERVEAPSIDLLCIVIVWIIGIAIVDPRGEFPLNDDWAVAQTVKHLLETGHYAPSGWLAMTLVTNVLWGALFCVPAGFSFTALRLSTLALSLLGMLGVYWLGRDLKLPRALRVAAALTLGLNPIYHALSSTFMTDVPFTALLILAALFFLRCLRDDSQAGWYIGIVIALAATLSRQLGIAVPLAFAIVHALRFGVGFRALLRGLLPLVICVLALLILQHVLSAHGELPAIYAQKNAELFAALHSRRLLLAEAVNGYIALVYFGLYLLPALAFAFPALWAEHDRRTVSLWLAAVITGGATLAFSRFIGEPLLPMLGNVLDPSGIGPFTLRDTYLLDHTLPRLPREFWALLTWAGIVGIVLIVAALALFAKRGIGAIRIGTTDADTAGTLFLWLCAAVYLFPIFTNSVGDRYLIPAVPFLMLGILSLLPAADVPYRRVFHYAGCALLLAFATYSICGTRDYLTWNRARWQALDDLTQVERVDSRRIDGGFEFNGWNFFDPNYARDPNRSWWWVEDDTYQIGFQSVAGYSKTKEYTYSHWLPPYTGKILVLKKSDLDFNRLDLHY